MFANKKPSKLHTVPLNLIFIRLLCSYELRIKTSSSTRTGGSESRTQVLASYCSSDVIDPGSRTHIL